MAPDPQARLSLSRFLSTSVHHIAHITLAILACVTFVAPAVAQTIAGGGQHTVVVTPDGHVWTWGDNGSNRLGLGPGASSKKVPTPVTALSAIVIVAVAAGNDFTLALDGSGVVWAWGGNGSGQLGVGDFSTRNVPTQITALSSLTIVAIAAGDGHSVALDSTGTVWTWGRNSEGELGNGLTTSSNVPVQLSAPTSVTAICAGRYHTLAVKNDGTNSTVWGWGYNLYGQLGLGTPARRSGPRRSRCLASPPPPQWPAATLIRWSS